MDLPDYNCVLCHQTIEESIFHLLIGCPFATACWNWLGLQITNQGELLLCLESFRDQLQVPFFMEVIILMCWTIWQMRNGLIFNNRPPSLQQAKGDFKSEFALLLFRAKQSYFPRVELWLNSLV
jgi:hypothetical protein